MSENEKNIIDIVKETAGIEPGSKIDYFIDTGIEQFPIVGKIFNSVKMRILERRVKRLQKDFIEINRILNNYYDDFNGFVHEKIFPLVLEGLMNDAQDEKVEFLLNGFKNVVINKIREEDKIIAYYDVLKETRVNDLLRLLEYTNEYKRWKNELRHERLRNQLPLDEEIQENSFKEQGYKKYIDTKLERLGLIESRDFENFRENFNRATRGLRSNNHKDGPELTAFGRAFIDFYNLTEKIR